MNDNNNFSVIKECIDFIQQRKREIDIGDSPFTEGDSEISYGIAEERKVLANGTRFALRLDSCLTPSKTHSRSSNLSA